MILSSQQSTLLATFPSCPCSEEGLEQILKLILRQNSTGTKAAVDWNMVYIHQAPTMLMSYSYLFLIIALTLHIISPLINRDPWGDGTKVNSSFMSNFEDRKTDDELSHRLQYSS